MIFTLVIMLTSSTSKHYLQLASDAAYVVDQAKQKFNCLKTPNFTTTEEFFQSRNQEMRDTGYCLAQVGTFADLNSIISEHVARIKGDLKKPKADTSQEVTSEAPSRKDETSKPKSLSSVYKGVSYNKKGSKYLSYIQVDKMRSLGSFKLESDAGLVSDIGNESFKGKRYNFVPESKYHAARKEEMIREGLTVDDVGTVESVKAKAEAKIAKILLEKPV